MLKCCSLSTGNNVSKHHWHLWAHCWKACLSGLLCCFSTCWSNYSSHLFSWNITVFIPFKTHVRLSTMEVITFKNAYTLTPTEQARKTEWIVRPACEKIKRVSKWTNCHRWEWNAIERVLLSAMCKEWIHGSHWGVYSVVLSGVRLSQLNTLSVI